MLFTRVEKNVSKVRSMETVAKIGMKPRFPCFFSSLLVSDVPGPFVGVYAKRPELPVQRRALHAHEFRGA